MSPNKKHKLVTGRGATAIYLALDHHCKNKEIIIPSNVCYAAVLPIYYSGNTPHFVDVNYPSGNMTAASIGAVINSRTGAVVYPYMYGNVTEEIIAVQQLCRDNGILLIEDCASAMGGKIGDIPVGNFGDYSIFSTGHAKNVDLDNGGILFTDLNIEDIEWELQKLPNFDEKIAKRQADFSRRYGSLRRSGDNSVIQELFDEKNELRDLFLYQLHDEELMHQVRDSFLLLENELNYRSAKYNLFAKNLPMEIIYRYNEGSLPWRFSVLVNNEKARQTIIERLLESNLFVSDWYPCIANAFRSGDNYPNARRMESEILNFSFQESDEDIVRTCDIINSVLQGEKI